MKRLLQIPEYVEDVKSVVSHDLPWDKLRGKTILITGGTGLIGSFLIDVLHAANLGCRVLLFGRSEEKAKARFAEYWDDEWIEFVKWDAGVGFNAEVQSGRAERFESLDYVIHKGDTLYLLIYSRRTF